MTQYSFGTATVVKGSSVVTGQNTNWLMAAAVGDSFIIRGDPVSYRIASVSSDTSLTLMSNYGGESKTTFYSISKNYTPTYGLIEVSNNDQDWHNLLNHSLRKMDNEVGLIAGGELVGEASSASERNTLFAQGFRVVVRTENIPEVPTTTSAAPVTTTTTPVGGTTTTLLPTTTTTVSGTTTPAPSTTTVAYMTTTTTLPGGPGNTTTTPFYTTTTTTTTQAPNYPSPEVRTTTTVAVTTTTTTLVPIVRTTTTPRPPPPINQVLPNSVPFSMVLHGATTEIYSTRGLIDASSNLLFTYNSFVNPGGGDIMGGPIGQYLNPAVYFYTSKPYRLAFSLYHNPQNTVYTSVEYGWFSFGMRLDTLSAYPSYAITVDIYYENGSFWYSVIHVFRQIETVYHYDPNQGWVPNDPIITIISRASYTQDLSGVSNFDLYFASNGAVQLYKNGVLIGSGTDTGMNQVNRLFLQAKPGEGILYKGFRFENY